MPRLLSSELLKTSNRIHTGIYKHFPGSGLSSTCDKLIVIACEADKTVAWIKRPNYYIKVLSWVIIGILVIPLVKTWIAFKISITGMNVADFFQMIDAGFNSIVLLGAAGIFLMTFETRRKRKRVINAVNKLRCVAHIIDAHQLTKDPISMSEKNSQGTSDRILSEYELGRYLDYCSEILSVANKIAFLYVQDFDDPVANQAVDDLEALTVGLSQKIWQKIVVLKTGAHNSVD